MKVNFGCAHRLRSALVLVLLAFLLTAQASKPAISFGGAEKFGLRYLGDVGSRSGYLKLRAYGDEVFSPAIFSELGGILCQGIATPKPGTLTTNLKVQYDATRPDGQRLRVVSGGSAFSPPLYDWFLLPTVRYADSEYTGAVSVIKNRVQFHPDLENNLVGLNLFIFDTLIFHAEPMRRATGGLRLQTQWTCGRGHIPGYNDSLAVDERRSHEAARAIGIQLLAAQMYSAGEPLRKLVITDVGVNYRFALSPNSLELEGEPYVLFSRGGEQYIPYEPLNYFFKVSGAGLLEDLNPIIYRTAVQTAQWAAFFRYLKRAEPTSWKTFVRSLETSSEPYSVETPVEFVNSDPWLEKLLEELLRSRSLEEDD